MIGTYSSDNDNHQFLFSGDFTKTFKVPLQQLVKCSASHGGELYDDLGTHCRCKHRSAPECTNTPFFFPSDAVKSGEEEVNGYNCTLWSFENKSPRYSETTAVTQLPSGDFVAVRADIKLLDVNIIFSFSNIQIVSHFDNTTFAVPTACPACPTDEVGTNATVVLHGFEFPISL
mmetsp:Transcript_64640/g.152886  ORF Transcript_64640/g.152886 Transcript_64640/m.152886 type:complete len:174 (+) Transcript_64640:1-522(+)